MVAPKVLFTKTKIGLLVNKKAAVEFIGALGLILPAITGIAPVLVPLAATGLAIVMLGAAVVHMRRGDGVQAAIAPLVLMLMAIFIAWGRFGAYAF